MDEQERGMMTLFEAETHSFLLRLWRENRDDPKLPAEWRGSIDHIQSGQRYYFRDLAEIGRIVTTYLGEGINPADLAFMPINVGVKSEE